MTGGRVLVTGGAGFIGSHLVDALLASGRQVVVYDDLSMGTHDRVSADAEFVEGDVRDGDRHLINAPFVDNSYKWAGGGFLSTTEDVLRFANAHLRDDFLSPSAKRLLFTEQQTRDGVGVGYGFGWFIRTDDAGRRLLYHAGGSVGGTSLMIMQPDTRVVVVGLINLTGANNGVVREVLSLFLDAVAASPSLHECGGRSHR